MAVVEDRLADLAGGYGSKLGEEAEATLKAGGKRLRPILVLMAAGDASGERAIRAATAVELLHMATLVHDDVLDGAPVRRGRPTVVARSGRDCAVGVGDLLLSRAFAELADGGGDAEVAELSSASVALALGELAQRSDAYDTSITEERYLWRCSLKTARLFESACRVGRLASGGPGSEDLASFGREIGLAFQLLDDVLDVTGPPERTGKARGTDLLDGTVTLPLILARRLDPGLASIELRGLDQPEAEAFCDRIAATDALDQVRGRARDGIESAKEIISSKRFTGEERQLLGMIADGVVERYS
ncbi:MAG TPA: polyprenyl synthetase family protein [Solirubrobacterales bacterium]|nr:polyprenyl synthetase family protein [Solirubrobacterales bacterium]